MTYTHRRTGEHTTATCDNPRCRVAITWRGAPDNPPPTARAALRGHECQPRGRK